MSAKPWREIRDKKLTAGQRRRVDAWVEGELLELDLREIRRLAGKTQAEMAELLEMAQSQVSRLEGRADHKLSTIRRVVEALGGKLEVVVRLGSKRLRLAA